MHAVTYIKGSVTMRAENIKSGNLLKALRAENGMLKILFAIGVLCAEHMWAGSRQSQDNLLLSQIAWAAGREQRYFTVLGTSGNERLRSYFVHLNMAMVPHESVPTEIETFAHQTCQQSDVCLFFFWVDPAHAASSLPLKRTERNALVAQYTLNRPSGESWFGCHNFGGKDRRCEQGFPQ
jgi:hypothetical protein